MNHFYRSINKEKPLKATEFPQLSNLEITNICNMDCPICTSKVKPFGKISIDLVDVIAKRNHNILAGKQIWLHHRGEPLLHPSLFEIVEILANHKIGTRISTNGLLLTDEMINKCINSKLGGLVVSIITTDPKRYEELRGKDCLFEIENNVKKLILAKKGNADSNLHIQVMGLSIGKDEEEIQKFVKKYHNLDIDVAIHSYSSRAGLSRLKSNFEENVEQNKRYTCEWPFEKIVIQWDGKIVPCCHYFGDSNFLGYIQDYEYSILEAWNSEKYSKFRKSFMNMRYIESCRTCQDWKYGNKQIDPRVSWYVKIYPATGETPYDV